MLRSILTIAFLCSVETFLLDRTEPTETYPFSDQLDTNGDYTLYWKANASHITFEVHVKTTGYVGFGISAYGKMFPSDVIIGWVDSNGHVYFKDRYTLSHSRPLIDKSQDWHVLYGSEQHQMTILKFVRKLDTCDDDEDRNIQKGTVRVIYSYHDEDPISETEVTYHGKNRGTKSLILLDRNPIPETIPADSTTFDFVNTNFTIPSVDTTYWCRAIQFPSVFGKNHMIKYEAIITPGNEELIRHMVVYICYQDVPDTSNGVGGVCYGHRPRELPQCYNGFLVSWSSGEQPYYFPDHVGYPIGDPNKPHTFILEIHYKNPSLKPDIIDGSGIRITVTKLLREYEAGLLEMGHSISFYQIIPPFQQSYMSKAYCGKECIEQGLAMHQGTEAIKIFGVAQHSHQIGINITTRHFRNNTELPVLAVDPYTDINFQEMRRVTPEVVVMPGDSFSVECTYNSTGRFNVTYGGMTAEEEMCLTFVYYYPKIDVGRCISRPSYNEFGSFSKVRNTIHSNGYNWNNSSVVADFFDKVDNSMTRHYCYGANLSTRAEYMESEVTKQAVLPPPRHC